MVISELPLLSAMAHHNGMSMIAVDINARITHIVGDIKHDLDFDVQSAIGQSIDSFFASDPDHAKLHHEALNNRSSKVVVQTKYGGFSEIQIVPLLDAQNNIIGAMGIETDVTERENAVRAHKDHTEQLERLFHDTENGIYLLDRNFVIQRANMTAAVIHEVKGNLEGNVCYKAIFGREQPCVFCPVIRTFQTGQSAEGVHYDAMLQKHLRVRSIPLSDPQTGELINVFVTFQDITDRVNLESTAQSQDALVTDIVASVQDGIFIINRDYTIIKTNPMFERMYSEHMPLIGKKCFVTSCLDHVCDDCPAAHVFETGEMDQRVLYERPTETKPGMWLEHVTYPICSPSGEVSSVICCLRDITQRKENEESLEQYRNHLEALVEERTLALEQSESRMRAILTGGNVPILFANMDGTTMFTNLPFQELMGYSEQELIQIPMMNIYDPQTIADVHFIQKRDDFYAEKNEQFRHDILIKRKNGEQRWVDYSVSVVRDTEGKRVQIVCVLLDITERYKMLQQVADAMQQTQIMLDTTPLICILINADGDVVDCNLEALRIFDIPNKKEFSKRFYDLSPEYQPDGSVSAQKILKLVAATLKTGQQHFEWLHRKPDGTLIPAEVTLVQAKQGDKSIVLGYVRDLREEKKMLAELREADELTRLMLDATPMSCTFWDSNLNRLDCNMEALRLFGVESKQEYCERFFDLSPIYQPDGKPSLTKSKEIMTSVFETGYLRCEWMHQKIDGTPIPCDVTLVRVKRGSEFVAIGYARDLREEKRMLAELREADDLTRLMLDATPLCCNLWDDQFNILDCNLATVNLFGLNDKQEYIGRFSDLSPDYQPMGQSSMEKAAELIVAAFRDGHSQFEWMHQKLDGTPIPCEVTLVRIPRGDGYIVASYTRDLRELKKHEEALKRDQLRTDNLLELAQMMNRPSDEIIDFALQSVIALTESTMGYVLNIENDYWSNTTFFRSLINDQSFVCPVANPTPGYIHPSSLVTECLKTKQAVVHNNLPATPGHRLFPKGHVAVHSHMNLPIMEGDKPIGIIAVGNKTTPYTETDIRQLTLFAQGLGNLLSRKKYAENLENAKVEAENANKAKSEFLAHMSHEIRTPLNGVIGLSDLLASTPLNAQQREYAQLINESGNALLFLINDILDFSKIEAGKLDIDSEPFDLAATIRSVLAALVSRVSVKNLKLDVSFCRNLPRTVIGDAGRVRQILLNLASNAVKFTDKGGVRIDISIETVINGVLTIRFSIVDTGIGIPKDRIDRLFKAFSQVDVSTARVYGGTGLGLAISTKLVQLMKGQIGVKSVEGKGSTFWFTVPFGYDPQIDSCLKHEECPKRQDCPNIDGWLCGAFVNREVADECTLKGRSVLVVVDNEIQCDAIRIQLQHWGMKCVTCGSGEEALRLSKEQRQPFDLIIIESTLADGTSIELARKLLAESEQHQKFVQVILLRPLSADFNQEVLDEINAETVGLPDTTSALFNAVMNRIFIAEKQKIHEGTAATGDSDTKIWRQQPTRGRVPSALTPLNAENRLKSTLAGKVHVLIVEDNRVNQIVAKNLLTEAGFTSDIANDGVEACSAVRNRKYHVVLMDCQMPEMDGFEATRLIRSWEREHNKERLPIIALTANATKEDADKCLDAGMDAYCCKPINPTAMIRLIEEWSERENTKSHQRQ
jgi:PAS domain S-box-containing protein